MIHEDKAVLRRRLRGRPPVSQEESAAVTKQLRRWLADRPGNVLIYLPMRGELDVTGVVDERHRWFVTRTPPGDLPLTVHSIDAPREVHRLGYEQPAADSDMLDPDSLDIVLTPSLSFARDGNRIGWGKGYYDRLFASATRAVAVGVTLERLLVESLPTELHDRRMDWLATERGVRPVTD